MCGISMASAQAFAVMLSLAISSAAPQSRTTSHGTAITLTQYEGTTCTHLDYTLELNANPDFAACTPFQLQGFNLINYIGLACNHATGEVEVGIQSEATCRQTLGEGVRFEASNYSKLLTGECVAFSSDVPGVTGFSYKLSGATFPQCETSWIAELTPTPLVPTFAPTLPMTADALPHTGATPALQTQKQPTPAASPTPPLGHALASAYLLNDEGSNSCPSGYKQVHSLTLCQQAMRALEEKGVMQSFQHADNQSSGCYQCNGRKYWYPTRTTGNGQAHCRQVCISVVPMPVQPATPTSPSPTQGPGEISACPDAIRVRNTSALRRNQEYMGVYTKVPDPPPHPFEQSYTQGKYGRVPIYWKANTNHKNKVYNTLFYWPQLGKWVFGDKQSFAGVGQHLHCPTDGGTWEEWVPDRATDGYNHLSDDWGVGNWIWNDYQDGAWEKISLEITNSIVETVPLPMAPTLAPTRPPTAGQASTPTPASTAASTAATVVSPSPAPTNQQTNRTEMHVSISVLEKSEQIKPLAGHVFLRSGRGRFSRLRSISDFTRSHDAHLAAPPAKSYVASSNFWDIGEGIGPILLLSIAGLCLCGVNLALYYRRTAIAQELLPERHDYSELSFCPNLVVPDHSTDYILYVPVPSLLDGDGPFDVINSEGERMVRIAPRGPSACHSHLSKTGLTGAPKPHTRHPCTVDWWRLLLLEPFDNSSVMAQCCAMGAREFHVRRVDGTFFAKLVHDADGDSYTLAVFDGRRYIYLGDRATCKYQIEDDAGVWLATAERCQSEGGFFTLRIAPSTEVGLVLCGILCVEWHVASLYRDHISTHCDLSTT